MNKDGIILVNNLNKKQEIEAVAQDLPLPMPEGEEEDETVE